jgi:hypothetical protein
MVRLLAGSAEKLGCSTGVGSQEALVADPMPPRLVRTEELVRVVKGEE